MKRILLCMFALAMAPAGFAKDAKSTSYLHVGKPSKGSVCQKVYLNLAAGFNMSTGIIGIGADVPVAEFVTVGAGLGISTWGSKYTVGAKYFFKPCQLGWGLGGGLTYNGGLPGYTADMESIYGVTQHVKLDLLPITSFYFAGYRYVSLGKGNSRFYATLGWSVPLTSPKFRQTDGDPISDKSKTVLNIISPGGLVGGIGFAFGLGR